MMFLHCCFRYGFTKEVMQKYKVKSRHILFCTELHILQVVACNQLVKLDGFILLSSPQL